MLKYNLHNIVIYNNNYIIVSIFSITEMPNECVLVTGASGSGYIKLDIVYDILHDIICYHIGYLILYIG